MASPPCSKIPKLLLFIRTSQRISLSILKILQSGVFWIGFAIQLAEAANVSVGCFCKMMLVVGGMPKVVLPRVLATVTVVTELCELKM
jgi:hypothetical protein